MTRSDRINLLERSVSSLGLLAVASLAAGFIGGASVSSEVEGGSAAVGAFFGAAGVWVLAAAAFLVARAITLGVLVQAVDD